MKSAQLRCEAVEAVDGVEACRLIDRANPQFDLVLLDIRMPLRDGFEVLDHIRNGMRLQALPVVMLSASDNNADIRRSYDFGANGYVRKQLDPDLHCSTLQVVLCYWLEINEAPNGQHLREAAPCVFVSQFAAM